MLGEVLRLELAVPRSVNEVEFRKFDPALFLMASLNLSGSLRDIPLPEILRLLNTSRRTGQLAISYQELTGSIFVEQGEIIDSKSNQLSGLDAIRHLALYTRGTFEFFDDVGSNAKTLSAMPTTKVIEVLEARLLEAIQIQELMPQDHEIPYYLGGAIPGDFEVNAAELAVAMKSAAGTFSTRKLARELGLDLIIIRYTVARFRSVGLMDVKEGTDDELEPPEIAPVNNPAVSSAPRFWRGRRID